MKKIFSTLMAISITITSLSVIWTGAAQARAYSGENGKIFYTKWGTNYPSNTSIRAINSDGSNDTQQIAGGIGFELSSPSTNKIVYDQYVSPTEERLMVANQDGSNATQIPLPGLSFGVTATVGDSFQFSFVNDTQIVFSAPATATGNVDVYRVNIDGTGLTKITNADSSVQNRYANPVVSPTGDRMLVETGMFLGSKTLNVMDMAGNTTMVIPLPGQLSETNYSWSPDGNQVVVTDFNGAGVTTVSVYNISSTTATLAYTVAPNNVSPTVYDATFSPDGQYIALIAPQLGADSGSSYVWTIPVGTPTGPAQQLVDAGVQLRGSGGNSWIDWEALPVTTSTSTPTTPVTAAPGTPDTGFTQDSKSSLLLISLFTIGSAGAIALMGRYISKRRI